MNKWILIVLCITILGVAPRREPTNFWVCDTDTLSSFVFDMRKGYSYFDGTYIHMILYDIKSQTHVDLVFPQEDFWNMGSAMYKDELPDTTSLEQYLRGGHELSK